MAAKRQKISGESFPVPLDLDPEEVAREQERVVELYHAGSEVLLKEWRDAETKERKFAIAEVMLDDCEERGQMRMYGQPFSQDGGGNPDLQNRVNSWNRIIKTVRKIDQDAAVELENMFKGASNAKVGKTMGERTEITTQFYIEAADKVRAWHTEILARYAGREEFYQIENQLKQLEPEVQAALRFNKICSEKVLNTEES